MHLKVQALERARARYCLGWSDDASRRVEEVLSGSYDQTFVATLRSRLMVIFAATTSHRWLKEMSTCSLNC